jgi:hypothetical protein
MGWVRQHKEGRHLRGVVRVVGEPGRFCVRLTEGDSLRRSHEGGAYANRDLALAVADLLARRQLRGHVCGVACTGWVLAGRPAR